MAPNDIRRVLVALDDPMESRSALVAAAGIAKRLHAELIGLFIEDTRLLQLAGHPAVRHVSGAGHAEAGADALAMERALRAQAALMHAALARAAETQALQWSFRVARGRVAAELLAAAPEADMMVLGKTSLSGKGRGAPLRAPSPPPRQARSCIPITGRAPRRTKHRSWSCTTTARRRIAPSKSRRGLRAATPVR